MDGFDFQTEASTTATTTSCSCVHKGMKGGGIIPFILNLGTTWRLVNSMARQVYPRGTISRYPLNTKLGEHQKRSGGLRQEINLSPLSGIEPRFLERPVRIPVTVCTDYGISAQSLVINKAVQLQFLEKQELCFCYSGNETRSGTQDAGVDTTVQYSPISLLSPEVLAVQII
jgi:hypothetical protein